MYCHLLFPVSRNVTKKCVADRKTTYNWETKKIEILEFNQLLMLLYIYQDIMIFNNNDLVYDGGSLISYK